MVSQENQTVLTPLQAFSQYGEELSTRLENGRMGMLPGLVGTIYFERGALPDGRQVILECFDRFADMFGEHLKGGKDSDEGRFTKRTAAGVEKIRRSIIETPMYMILGALRASATDCDTAAEYKISVLTGTANPQDRTMRSGCFVPAGHEAGLSLLKFNVPMEFTANPSGLAQYEAYLRFVCEKLKVRGGYGGYAPLLPYSYHSYMPQEWALLRRFCGLDMVSTAHLNQAHEVYSYEGDSPESATAIYRQLVPGAKVDAWGFIKSVNWYTILGPVFVERLGGLARIRESLSRPDIRIEEINSSVAIRAGEFPRLGAPEEGLPEPYVFVNSVLRVLRDPKPDSLHTFVPDQASADRRNIAAWEARFDPPCASPIPEPPTIVPPQLEVLQVNSTNKRDTRNADARRMQSERK
ncbi:type VI immunity family protein [Paraburkholderia tropica]|uniref:type VI immunity family protein n=1 Tax=Paraburkholderia tropica TaxID=92647 RepID=UPI002AB29360|nr:type VI immunity family protein [Paraburkholderia tropica]